MILTGRLIRRRFILVAFATAVIPFTTYPWNILL
jgi:hypothetical protein